MKVTITPMPSCFVSISFTIYGKSVSCYGCNYMDMHVLPKLASVTTIFVSFDLGMSRGGVGTLAWVSTISLKLESLCMLLLVV